MCDEPPKSEPDNVYWNGHRLDGRPTQPPEPEEEEEEHAQATE